MSIKLSDDLKYWRAERPDEWKMDEFIRDAEYLELNLIPETNYAVFAHTDNGDYEQLTHWISLLSAKEMAANWYDKDIVISIMGRVL